MSTRTETRTETRTAPQTPASSAPRPRGAVLGLLYGGLAYAGFAAVLVWLIAFLAGLPTPRLAWLGPQPPASLALLVNAALILLFAGQHSAMARPAFKQRLARLLPRSVERATYVLASDLALAHLLLLWQPVGGTLWRAEGLASAVLWALFVAGWAIVAWTTFLIHHFELFGLRQVWLRFRGRPYTPVAFQSRSLYRWSRNPMHVGTIAAFWATQTMTLDRLLLALGMTAYTLLSVEWEERDLANRLGESFRAYQRAVPKYLGLPRRAPQSVAQPLADAPPERVDARS